MAETSPQVRQDLIKKLKHGQIKKLLRLLIESKVAISYGTLENYMKGYTMKPRRELIEKINEGLVQITGVEETQTA